MTGYLVTGAAGFIGSNLAEGILAAGHRVVGVDNFLTGKRENITSFQDRMEFHEGDIRDLPLMRHLCEGVDFVLHHAALASVPWSVDDPVLAHDHNVTGTLNVLVAARDAGVKRVVAAVTSAAYGDTEIMPCVENQPVEALSPYAATKLMDEMYAALFSRIYGLPTVGLRYFNVFGKRQDPNSAYAAAIPVFVHKALQDEPPVIFGDGEQTRDFIFIEDVIEANLKACEAGPEANGQVFNIGTGKSVTINALCNRILELLGKDLTPSHGPIRKGDVLHSLADIEKARRVFGYSPNFDDMTGLEKSIGWYRENL
jgi:UDP-N-acetylglucosamine 4-epimerase